jgi:hypothetical protein
MKKYIFFIIFLLAFYTINAQYFQDQKRDYIWKVGYNSGDGTHPDYGTAKIDFNHDTIVITKDSSIVDNFVSNTSMCDTSGNLLFHSNGLMIAEKMGGLMLNGDSLLINPYGYETYSGLEISQGIITLPVPECENQYVVLQQDFDLLPPGDIEYSYVVHLFYAWIDMNANEDLGEVVEKHVLIKNDTLTYGQITACRHANGRDWWIIIPQKRTTKYYRFCLTPEGFIEYPPDTLTEIFAWGAGQAHFSPDGNKYIRFTSWGGVTPSCMQVYDFDRCHGLLSNPRNISKPDFINVLGGAVSPNSRYAYFIEFEHIWQYDLEAVDIAASEVVVAIYDGFYDSFELFRSYFTLAQLAPNGKIYIMTPNSTRYFHIINHPDSAGIACEVIQHGFELPRWNNSIPHYPNFRLGPIDGSPCDTLGINNPVATEEVPIPQDVEVRVYPNPVSDYFFVHFAEPVYDAVLMLYDAAGKEVLSKSLSAVVSTIDVRNLPGGLYLYSICDKEDEVIKTGKIVINVE